MPSNLLETDKALEALVDELRSLESTTRQLQNAERTANEVIQSAEKVTDLSVQIVEGTNKQVDVVSKLAAEVEQKMKAVIAEQKAFTQSMNDYLRRDLQPGLEKLQRTSRVNRLLLSLTLVLLLGNFALLFWLNRTLLMP